MWIGIAFLFLVQLLVNMRMRVSKYVIRSSGHG